jgi:hypothetical protein
MVLQAGMVSCILADEWVILGGLSEATVKGLQSPQHPKGSNAFPSVKSQQCGGSAVKYTAVCRGTSADCLVACCAIARNANIPQPAQCSSSTPAEDATRFGFGCADPHAEEQCNML